MKTHARLGGEETHAHLLGPDGRDIRLTMLGPVDLGQPRPGWHTIVALKAETLAFDGNLVEPDPPAYGRMQPIGGDEPAVRHPEPLALYLRGRHRPDRSGPVDRHPDLVGTLDEGMMEQGTSDTHAYIGGKGGVHTQCAVHEAEADQGSAVLRCEVDAQAPQGGQGLRHYPFATHLVDGWVRGFQYDDPQSLQACRDSRSQPGRAPAHDDDIGLVPSIPHRQWSRAGGKRLIHMLCVGQTDLSS